MHARRTGVEWCEGREHDDTDVQGERFRRGAARMREENPPEREVEKWRDAIIAAGGDRAMSQVIPDPVGRR